MSAEPVRDVAIGDSIKVRIAMPEAPEKEARFANHIEVTFAGSDFIVTLAQVIPPGHRIGGELPKAFRDGVIEARVLERFAIPVEHFVKSVNNVSALIENLRAVGALTVDTALLLDEDDDSAAS